MGLQTDLRGESLALLRIALVVVPSSFLFGYNQSNIGGVLGFESFTRTFPRIDTAHTHGHEKVENSRIQGRSMHVKSKWPSVLNLFRNCRCNILYRLPHWDHGHRSRRQYARAETHARLCFDNCSNRYDHRGFSLRSATIYHR